jgi:hypothetical protein
MDRETIIKLAREAGFEIHERKLEARVGMDALAGIDSTPKLERFAKLVAEHVIKDAPDYKMGYADGVFDERKTIAQMVKPLDESLANEILSRSQE